MNKSETPAIVDNTINERVVDRLEADSSRETQLQKQQIGVAPAEIV